MRKIALVMALALSACAGAPPPPKPAALPNNLQAFVQWVGKLTDTDLANGIQIAQSNGLKADVDCLIWMQQEKALVANLGQNGLPISGPVSALEAGHAALSTTGNGAGILSDFNLHCAAMANDINFTLIKFGVLAAGTAATGGAIAPLVPLIPTILSEPVAP